MFSKKFRELKKNMRREAKKNKTIKYSFSMLLLFLISGKVVLAQNETELLNKNINGGGGR